MSDAGRDDETVPDVDQLLDRAGFDPETSVLARWQAEVLALCERGVHQSTTADFLDTSRANVSSIEASTRANVERARETVTFVDALTAPVRVEVPIGSDFHDVPKQVYDACDEAGMKVDQTAPGLMKIVSDAAGDAVEEREIKEQPFAGVTSDGRVRVCRHADGVWARTARSRPHRPAVPAARFTTRRAARPTLLLAAVVAPDMELGLDGGTVVVTTSSAGLGRASAAVLADEGANVVVCGRNPERLTATESELDDLDGSVLDVETDIMNKGDIEALVEAAIKEFGGVDHVVTPAGGVPPGGFAGLTERKWYGAFDMLVMSTVWTVRATRPHLEVNDMGTITYIISASVREVIDDLILSNAVRRGAIGLVKSLSREPAPSVRVNAVLPSAHKTNRIEELAEAAVERGDHDTYKEGLDSWSDGIPLGRAGDPRELGGVVTFLASDRASFVTGAYVPVDGGRLRSA